MEAYRSLLTKFQKELIAERASYYRSAISNKGSPLSNCVGFIDCTKIKLTRPGGASVHQQSVYSGHKRQHCLIYQTISTPDGLIFHMYGPEVGRRHDLTILRFSGLPEVLPTAFQIDDSQHYIFGDAAYMTRPWLQAAWPGPILSAEQLSYNRKMNSLRTSVELSYKDIKQMWSSQDFSRL